MDPEPQGAVFLLGQCTVLVLPNGCLTEMQRKLLAELAATIQRDKTEPDQE